MKNRISIYELVAYNNTPKAKAMVIRYGYEPATNYKDLASKLYKISREYREEAMADLAELHPHKDLILHVVNSAEDKSSACGCQHSSANGNNEHGKGCKCPECKGYSNFEMEEYIDFLGKKNGQENSPMQKFNEYLPLIAVAGLFALAITVIGKKA